MEFDHVGVAVKSIDDALSFYSDVLGLEVGHEEEFEGMRIVFVEAGDGEFELLEPLEEEGAIARHLENRGEGIQHAALKVDDLEKELERLKEAGVKLLDEEPRAGAAGKEIAFIHPGEANGVLLELCEY